MASPGMWQSPTRLYVDKTRARIVPENSPEAAFVLVGAGSELPVQEAERLGLIEVREGQIRELEIPEGGTPAAPVVVQPRAAVSEPAAETTEEPTTASEPVATVTQPEPETETIPMPKEKPASKDK